MRWMWKSRRYKHVCGDIKIIFREEDLWLFDDTSAFDPADIESNKVMGILSYLSWLVLIPLIAAPKSPFARFHANQGLILAIIEIAFGIVLGALSLIPVIGIVFNIILSLLGLVFLLFSILGIVNAANGKAKELPVIGKIRLIK